MDHQKVNFCKNNFPQNITTVHCET